MFKRQGSEKNIQRSVRSSSNFNPKGGKQLYDRHMKYLRPTEYNLHNQAPEEKLTL